MSSVSSGKIYKNIHCARCHGQTNTTLWRATISLENYLKDQIEQGNSEIDFANIKESFNVTGRRCFNGMIINQCPSSGIVLPDTISMSVNDVKYACQNGKFSPYVHENIYSNIFCLMCNVDLRAVQYSACQNLVPLQPFTAVLIPSTSTNYQKRQQKLACINSKHIQVHFKRIILYMYEYCRYVLW